jgi:hypothetical protein
MMSTNNIDDSNNCDEKKADRVSLCGIADAEVSEQADEVCASCGIAEVDNVKHKKCTCDLVKYHSDEYREEHREQHAEQCKNRAKELHDKKLFTQPDSCCYGECPLCFLPMPLNVGLSRSLFYSCCSKTICYGCEYANDKSNGHQSDCPFCREIPLGDDEGLRRMMKRIEDANDSTAMTQVGTERYNEGDYDGAFEYWTKAAEFGHLKAHHNLGVAYDRGEGVEKDKEKEVYHYEIAAIGGHPGSRFNLGNNEERNGNMKRAVKHFIIAANLGHIKSMRALWRHYSHGNITKVDLEVTLRTHQAAIDAMKSPQREEAAAAYAAYTASIG